MTLCLNVNISGFKMNTQILYYFELDLIDLYVFNYFVQF